MIRNILNNIGMSEGFINLFVDNIIEYEDPFSEDLSVNSDLSLNDLDRLKITLFELNRLYDYYISHSLSLEIMYLTLSDLKLRIDRYYDEHGVYGLTKHDMKWLGYIFRGETYQIGSLKFRKYPLTYLEIERSGLDYLPLSETDKLTYYEGLPVIYVHIAKNADLSESSVTDSFNRAKLFFETYFSDYKYEYFVCRTWMIYPGLDNILSKDSNIIKFKNRFEIVAVHHEVHQSLSRIYDTTDLEKIKKNEKRSSLAKLAYQNLDSLGVAFGIIRKKDI